MIPDILTIIVGICFYKANIVNRFLCHKLNFYRNVIVWFVEHRNLKNLSNKSNHESDNSILELQESTKA